MALLQQMRADALDPTWFNRRNRARIKPRRFNEFGSDDPSSRFFQQRRSGPDEELDAACAGVRRLAPLGVRNARADIAQQPREQCDVNLLECRWRWIDAPTVLAGDRRQLRMHVDPLANAARTEKVALELVGEFSIRLLMVNLVLHERPQLDQRQEIALVVSKSAVRVIGGILCFQRTLARDPAPTKQRRSPAVRAGTAARARRAACVLPLDRAEALQARVRSASAHYESSTAFSSASNW